MEAAFCACLPVPGVFSSVRESFKPSLGVSSAVLFVQSREELSIRLLQHSSPPNLASSPPGNSQELFQTLHPGFLVHWCPSPFGALPPCWIQCPVLLSLRLIGHGHPSSGAPVALQCCPWTQSQAPGRISGCIVKFILAIKAPLFSWQKRSFLFSTEFSSDTLILRLLSFGSDPFISALVTASSISLNAENVKHLSVPFEAGHPQPQNLHLRLNLRETTPKTVQETSPSSQNLSGILCIFKSLLIPFKKSWGLASFHSYSALLSEVFRCSVFHFQEKKKK